MELIWGEDFDVLTEVARSVFADQSPLVDRDVAVDSRGQIRQFAQLDWLTLGDPRGKDEAATGLASMAAVFVEHGRALAHSPLASLVTARDAALLCGTGTAAELAEAVGDGSVVAVTAFHDPAWRQPAPTLHDGTLSGTIPAVPYADIADVLIVEAVQHTSHGEMTPVVVAIRPDTDVACHAMPNLGDHSMFEVTCMQTPVSEGDILALGDVATAVVSTARCRALVLLAAQVYGAGVGLLERTVRYATERRQFGGPIGRFQAVQYLCTDIAVGVHLTSAFIREAARQLDEGADPVVEVALMAKQAASTAQEMVHAAHEVHAGIGFMVESDIHLYTKAAKKWAFDLGDARRHDDDILAQLMNDIQGGHR